MILPPRHIHVWLAHDRAPLEERVAAELAATLGPAERAHLERRRSPELQRAYLLAHALRRAVLSRYAPQIAPAAWQFIAGEHGKPALADAQAALGLHFNLAHTGGLMAFAVSCMPEVGVDAENLRARAAALRIAHRYFTAEEARALASLPPARQPRRFYALWTLKEAWMKASGLGLAAGLDNASFALDDDDRLAGFSPAESDAADWRFWQFAPTPAHALAVAVHAPGIADAAQVSLHEWEPRGSAGADSGQE